MVSSNKMCIYLFLTVLGLCCCMGFSLVGVSGATLHCSVQASHCGGLSSGAWALGPAGLGSCGTWVQQLQLPGSRTQAQ